MIKFVLTLEGTAPLLMHNSQLVDEFNPIVKEMKKITDKRTKKTEDDRWELRRLEHLGSLYYEEGVGPHMPAQNIEASLAKAAGLTRNGQDVKRGVRITSPIIPLVYQGPRTPDELWNDPNHVHNASVKVGMSRVIRTRPVFRQWILEADGILDPNIVDLESFTDFAVKAGSLIGLGDWRPRFGTFNATVEVQ